MLLAVIIGCLFLDSEPLAAGNKGTKPSESSGLWALNKLRKPEKPKVKETNWPRVPFDYFILKKIEQAELAPTRQAEKRTLARRAYLDLHGLPPTTAELKAFLEDGRPDAWQRLIDGLLDSPRYGERWGRHWLDVAR